MKNVLVCLLACVLLARCSAGQEPALRPGRLSSEEREALETGLQASFSSPRSDQPDVRTARLPALFVPAGAAATPFISRGPFRATFTGYLKMRLRGERSFSVRGRGAVRMSINGEEVQLTPRGDLATIEPVTVSMAKGYNKLRIDYESPFSGHAQCRLYWSSDEFPAEPVPPTVLFHDGRDSSWQAGQRLRAGRELLARYHCFNCHQAPKEIRLSMVEGKSSMPELRRDAPSLAGISTRVNRAWLVQWILAPHRLRSRATMPRVLAHQDETTANAQATDIAAYLFSLPAISGAPAPTSSAELRHTGQVLFEDRGCIACHRFSAPEAEDERDRVSLHFADAKYHSGALRAFLDDPRAHYSWSRMPRVPLDADETLALATFLRAEAKGRVESHPPTADGDAARGKQLFVDAGCSDCHAVGTGERTPPQFTRQITADGLHRGCLAGSGTGDSIEFPLPGGEQEAAASEDSLRSRSPRFSLSADELAALRAILRTDLSSLTRRDPVEFAVRQWREMNCRACHIRDGHDAVLPYVLIDEGSQGFAAEPVPSLTWAGEKLRPDWTRQLLTGRLGYHPRPHFKVRMPVLPLRGALLAEGLCYEHGFALDEDPRPVFESGLAEMGAGVAAMNSGLACHRCHAIGDQEATAPFEARSTNLSYATERLRYGFYHRWMRDPLRIEPATKMIKFAQDGKRTGLDRFYDGDAQQQFDAVWHYLELLNRQIRSAQ